MHSAAPAQQLNGPRTPWRRGFTPRVQRSAARRKFVQCLLRTVLRMVLLGAVWLASTGAIAAKPELTVFDVTRDEDGVYLTFAVDLGLSASVEDALEKGVPLFFVAEAEIFRDRWYWRDRRVADAVQIWRIVYQPLTASYRVAFGGLTQNYASREEAVAAISRSARWKIAEPGQIEEGSHHYVEFSYRLDTALLPRPMQIGVGGQAEWHLVVKRTLRLN